MAFGLRISSFLVLLPLLTNSSTITQGLADSPPLEGMSLVRTSSATAGQVAECTTSPTLQLRAGNREQLAQAFRLSPQGSSELGGSAKVEAAGVALGTGSNLGSLLSIARNFYNVSHRLESRQRELCAYQLAVWHFSADLDVNSLPPNDVTTRALKLINRFAGVEPRDRATPISEPRIELTKAGEYTSGEAFVAHVYEANLPERDPIPGALLRFTNLRSGAPLRIMETDENGDATLNLPNDRAMVGDLQARWTLPVPPGTFIRTPSEHGLLFEGLSLPVSSNTVAHVSPSWVDLQKRTQSLAADYLGGLNATSVLSLELLVILGVVGFVATRVQTLKGLKAVVAGVVVVLAIGFVARLLAQKQEHEFNTEWSNSPQAQVATDPVTATLAWVGQTSEYRGEHDAAFSGACATDDTPRSAWLSLRGLGTGQILALGFDRTLAVQRVNILPGWFESPGLYSNTAKPQRIQVFGETGLVQEQKLPESYYEEDPESISIELEHPIPTSVLYIRILRIEGDTRTYTAISEASAEGLPSAEVPPRDISVDNINRIIPRVFRAPDCATH